MFQVHSRLCCLVNRLPFRRLFSARPPYILDLKENVCQIFQQPKEDYVNFDSDNNLNVAFFANKHNSLSQRLALELNKMKHNVKVFEVNNSDEMSEKSKRCQADLILAPFLTKRVPEDVYTNVNVPFIIVHPGIEGDRGRHSLDWALKSRKAGWGVTLLQAAEEMDAGDIWSTSDFLINRPDVNTLTKSSLYTNEVTEAAVRCTLETIERFQKKLVPRPLDYSNANVKGTFNPPLKKVDRIVDWKGSADEVAAQVRMSDSSPGAIATLLGKDSESNKMHRLSYRAFGAHLELSRSSNRGIPGEIIGQRHGAILVQCGDGAVWLSHLKKNKLKLPSASWLKNEEISVPTLKEPHLQLPHGVYPSTFQEIWTWLTVEGICYVHFNFYNGAMNAEQCQRLSNVLRIISRDDNCKVVVLMGGYNFFSNGIHLNCIENSQNPSIESLQNITAINDVVRDIFCMQDKLTISAVQGNAGAGGVMMALASDLVLSRDGVVLNPHYTSMSLFGSEYHTFFLEERLGRDSALQIMKKELDRQLEAILPKPETMFAQLSMMTSGAESILSSEAVAIGLFDGVMGSNVVSFQNKMQNVAQQIAVHPSLSDLIRQKSTSRDMAWHERVEKCRQFEIENMMRNFQSEEYETARRNFVLH